MPEFLEFPSSKLRYHNRPVWLVPVVPVVRSGDAGSMARGMMRGGAIATYSGPRALVAASKALTSYYERRRYARCVGRMVYDPQAPALPNPHWFTILDGVKESESHV